MKKLLLFLSFYIVICINEAYAQQMSASPMDELERFEQSSGKERIEAANSFLGKLYDVEFIHKLERYDLDSSLDTICKHVYFRATEYAFYELEDYDKTLYYGMKAVKVMRNCHEIAREGECESILAIANFRRSDFKQALKHALNDLDIQKRLEDVSSISSALNTIAGIYLATRNEEEAYEYIKQAITYSTEANDTSRMAIQQGMASEILLNLEEYEESLRYARAAYQLDSLKGNRPKMGIRLSQQASPLIKMKKYADAERVLKEAISILKEYKIGVSVAICQNQLGVIANIRENHAEAVELFTQSLAYFLKQHDYYNEVKAREGLCVALRETNPAEALKHMERLSVLKDSLYDKEMEQMLSKAHAEFSNEQLILQQEHHRKEKILLRVIIVAVVLICVILSVYLFYVFRKHRREQQEMRLLEKEVVTMDTDDVLSEEDAQFLKDLNRFIDEHMSEIFEVDSLALHLSVSPKQLNRKLTAILGCNTYAYIIRRRIDYACHLLIHSTMRISDIGMACGFDNPSNFARAFKETKGSSPSLFRKEHLVK